jgi:lipopolysaccharide/colanic/teichoic acid biosynthesis glycosyltransferase
VSVTRHPPPGTAARGAIRPDSAPRRLTDVAVAAVALTALIPLLAVIALTVRLTSPGPAIYLSQRVGRGGQPFRMLKFRTMICGADRGGSLVSGTRDPRVTRVGAVLRATKADELPQFLNVLCGQMTLVGPRPEVARYVASYTTEELATLCVRPGLTGPGQLHFTAVQSAGLDGPADPEDRYVGQQLHPKLALDLDYLRHRSARGDLMVVLRTVRVLLRH